MDKVFRPPRLIKRDRIFILIKYRTFERLRQKLSRRNTCHMFDVEENEYYQIIFIIIVLEDWSLKEPTPGTTGSENFWFDMRRS